MSKSRTHITQILASAWVALLLIALALDRPVAVWVRDTIPVNKNHHVTHLVLETLKLPGWFPFTCIIAVALGIFHRRHALAAASLIGSGIVAGAFYSVIKWIVGRHRPVIEVNPWKLHPFIAGLPGLWREKALCFPSGHASLAFSSAMCLAILIPRFGWAFFLIAAVTACERVLENAHYLSDVVAGAGLGVCVAWAITWAILSIGASREQATHGLSAVPPVDRT